MAGEETESHYQLSRSERISASVGEIPGVISYLRRSKDQRLTSFTIASEIFAKMYYSLRSSEFFSSDESPQLGDIIGWGYSFSVYKFTNSRGSWVFKVGNADFPLRGYPSPSSPFHTRDYQREVDILRDTFSHTLPHLLLEPHYSGYFEFNGQGRTCIIEPFLDNAISFDEIRHLPQDQRVQLLRELRIFDEGCRKIKKYYGLIPDIYRKTNFCFRYIDGQAHLTLVDRELTNKEAPSPIFNLMNSLKYSLRVHREMKRLARSYRNL